MIKKTLKKTKKYIESKEINTNNSKLILIKSNCTKCGGNGFIRRTSNSSITCFKCFGYGVIYKSTHQ